MPLTEDPYYCSEQIQIPPALPDILKQFTKAAIRTQPKDVLAWSCAYFKAMSEGEAPPVKERLEFPIATQKTDTGLTPGLLRTLHKQLGPKRTVPISLIEEKWKDVCLPMEQFQELSALGNFVGDVEWLQFHALAACSLTSNLTESMKLMCELLTADPSGGPARISFELWTTLYKYIADIDGKVEKEQIDKVIDYLSMEVLRQEGMVLPRNFLHPDCPKLH